MNEDLAVVVVDVEGCRLVKQLTVGTRGVPTKTIWDRVGPGVERRVELDDNGAARGGTIDGVDGPQSSADNVIQFERLDECCDARDSVRLVPGGWAGPVFIVDGNGVIGVKVGVLQGDGSANRGAIDAVNVIQAPKRSIIERPFDGIGVEQDGTDVNANLLCRSKTNTRDDPGEMGHGAAVEKHAEQDLTLEVKQVGTLHDAPAHFEQRSKVFPSCAISTSPIQVGSQSRFALFRRGVVDGPVDLLVVDVA